MSQPFNFNTPINQNTTLVARYRCGSAPYAGKWFRATTTNGKQYVPTSIEEAESAAGVGFPYLQTSTNHSRSPWHLVNVGTGLHEDVWPSDVVKLEFGGGWRSGMAGQSFFEIQNDSFHSKTPACTNLRYITGYPEGIVPDHYILPLYGSGFSGNEASAEMGKLHQNLNIDLTGFRFDKNMWSKMIDAGTSTSDTWGTLFTPCYYGSSSYQITLEGGVFGDVEPLFSPSEVTMSEYVSRSLFGCLSPTGLNYTKGIGFSGQYASEWLEKVPSRAGLLSRTTYLA